MDVAGNIGRHPHPDPNGLLSSCPASPFYRRYSSSPIVVIATSSFTHSCLHQIPFGMRFWSSLLSPLHTELQESFCCPCFLLRCRLLHPRPGDLHSARRCVLVIRCASKKYLVGTLLKGTFGSLHVLFLCVHSIFVFMTFHCPICRVNVLTLRVEEVLEKATATETVAKVLRYPRFVLKESHVPPTFW